MKESDRSITSRKVTVTERDLSPNNGCAMNPCSSWSDTRWVELQSSVSPKNNGTPLPKKLELLWHQNCWIHDSHDTFHDDAILHLFEVLERQIPTNIQIVNPPFHERYEPTCRIAEQHVSRAQRWQITEHHSFLLTPQEADTAFSSKSSETFFCSSGSLGKDSSSLSTWHFGDTNEFQEICLFNLIAPLWSDDMHVRVPPCCVWTRRNNWFHRVWSSSIKFIRSPCFTISNGAHTRTRLTGCALQRDPTTTSSSTTDNLNNDLIIDNLKTSKTIPRENKTTAKRKWEVLRTGSPLSWILINSLGWVGWICDSIGQEPK
jgi:hypothetical protein